MASSTYLLSSALMGLLFGAFLACCARILFGLAGFQIAVVLVPFAVLHMVLKQWRWKNGRQWYTLSVSAAALGVVALLGTELIGTNFTEYGWFLLFIVFYHFGEYSITAYFHHDDCSVSSFLIDHSTAYSVAFLAGQTEFFVEKLFFKAPWKGHLSITYACVLILILCEIFRKGGMITAGVSFTHMVAYEKKEKHKLVTWGLYHYVRHPGYFGWFWWSIFTQVLLANPFCTIAYTAAAWRFFADRIPDEEEQLIKFFPGEYEAYRSKTPTLIPFIP